MRRSFKSVFDAAQDRRVNMADAEDAFARAVARAVADRANAMKVADDKWRAACKRARDAAVKRRAVRVSLRSMTEKELLDLYRRWQYILSDDYAQYRNAELEEVTLMNMYMGDRVLAERGMVAA